MGSQRLLAGLGKPGETKVKPRSSHKGLGLCQGRDELPSGHCTRSTTATTAVLGRGRKEGEGAGEEGSTLHCCGT